MITAGLGSRERFCQRSNIGRDHRDKKSWGEQESRRLRLLSRTAGDFGRKCPTATLDDGDPPCLRAMSAQAGEESCEIAAGGSGEMHRPAEALAHDGI